MSRTGFYLLDRPVPGPRKWHAADEPKRVLVQHITAGLQGLALTDDQSAEATARYAATTDRAVSWHDGVDTDSVVRLLPPGYVAFHAKGANRDGIGQEISKKTTRWAGMPAAWTAATLHNAAEAWRPHVERYGIDLRVLTPAERARGLRGFIAHAALDPSRRSDPGGDFPWERLFELIAHPGGRPASPSRGRPTARLGSRGSFVEELQRAIGARPDGRFGPDTYRRLVDWQARHGLVADGICGPATWARIDEETSGALRPEEDDMPQAVAWTTTTPTWHAQPIPPVASGAAGWGPGWLSLSAGAPSAVEVWVVQEDGRRRPLWGSDVGPVAAQPGVRLLADLQPGDHIVQSRGGGSLGFLVEYGRAA